MYRPTLTLWICGAVVLSSATTTANAQQLPSYCDNDGLALWQTLAKTDTETRFRAQFKSYVERKEFTSATDFNFFALDFKIPIEEVEVPIGLGTSDEEIQTIWRTFVESRKFDEWLEVLESVEIRYMQDVSAGYWRTCEPNRRGLFVTLEQTRTPTSARLFIEYSPVDPNAAAVAIPITLSPPNTAEIVGHTNYNNLTIVPNTPLMLSIRRIDPHSELIVDVGIRGVAFEWVGDNTLPAMPTSEQLSAEALTRRLEQLEGIIDSLDRSSTRWEHFTIGSGFGPIVDSLNVLRPRPDGIQCSSTSPNQETSFPTLHCWVRVDGDGPTDYQLCSMAYDETTVGALGVYLGDPATTRRQSIAQVGFVYQQAPPRYHYVSTPSWGGPGC